MIFFKTIDRKTKTLFRFPYYEAQIKSRGFSYRKENEEPNLLLF